MNRDLPSRIWIDVEDLFQYAQTHPRISGIQRVMFELCTALRADPNSAGRLGFVRHGAAPGDCVEVGWESIAALVARLSTGAASTASRMSLTSPPPAGGIKGRVVRGILGLPREVEEPLGAILRSHFAAIKSWVQLVRGIVALARRRRRVVGGDAAPIRPGDMLLLLGSPWALPDHVGWIDAATQRHGLRVALLVYDLIQLRFEEFFDPIGVERFRAWLDAILPRCEAIFAISHATAADTELRLREIGLSDAPRVVALPMGTGFTPVAPLISPALPAPGSYVLIVGTIEARKNHLAAFRAWRRLLATMPRAQVPKLVFAGRPGALVADLMQQLVNTHGLGGKIIVIPDACDAEMTALYEGCLFTLFPSYAEGWGLPVSESLAFGKPCLCADRTSLPEAGMGLARLFDPDDLNDLVAQLRALISNPDDLADWTARVRAQFQPVPWSLTAQRLLDGLSQA